MPDPIKLSEYAEAVISLEANDYQRVLERLSHVSTIRLLHAGMGICTEAGEFMDALKKHIMYGSPNDLANLIEELGDIEWYRTLAMVAIAQQLGFSDVTHIETLVRELNVEKLKRRYPDKFSESDATHRDLDNEKSAMDTVLERHGIELNLKEPKVNAD